MAIEQNGNYSPSERLVSPGVFTREINQTYLAQGVAAIGGVVVAPFNKGPGFSPTVVRSEGDLVSIFGDPDGTLYGPITAQQYIRQQGQVTICRVGGLSGYEQSQALCVSAVPGLYTRHSEVTATTGSLIGAPVPVAVTPGSKNFTVVGTLLLTFDAGVHSGSTVVVGDINFNTLSNSKVANITTSSYDVFESVTLTSSLALTSVAMPHQGTVRLQTGTVITMLTTSGCQAELSIVGNLSGSYGDFDPTSFVAGVSLSENSCGSASYQSGSEAVVLAVLANTALDRSQNLYGFSGSLLTSYSVAVSADFSLLLKEAHLDNQNAVVSSSYGTYNFSLDAGSTKFITSVFGSDPTTGPKTGYLAVPAGQKVEAAYIYKIFKNKMSQIVDEMLNHGTWKIVVKTYDAMTFADGITPDVGTSLFDLTNAYTPFIRSQLVSSFTSGSATSSAAYELFKVHTLSDGTPTNTQYKVEIANVKSAGSVAGSDYGSFSLIVRNYSDSDSKPAIVERYDNLNLDVNSSNYVARRIGDTWNYIDFNGKIVEFGDYPNKSKTIRVEMSTAPWPVESIPFGFGPYAAPLGGELARLGKFAAMQYCSASIYSLNPGRYASGVVFQPAPSNADAELAALYPNGSSIGPELDNKQYFSPVPYGSAVGANVAFDLETYCGVTPLYVPADEATNVKKRRFVLGFQGGFDGMSPSVPVLVGNDILPTNQQGLDCSTNLSLGSMAYKQAVASLSNADEWDFNLITTPGINHDDHSYVTGWVLDMCEKRGDAFYIMDISHNQLAGDSAIQNVVDLSAQIDSNYVATYYPWVKVSETNSNKVIAVPPSVVMMGVYAANDKVAAEWFAPAGLNRGGIPTAVQVADRLTHTERDTLYEGKVNPIAAFPGQGIVAWGQKTLQRTPSALDRINVRRLLIAVKKFIAASSRFLVFEQNVATTRQRFLNIVNPYLEGVQQRSGVYAFKVVMDESNNTPDLVDRGILYGQIYIQPTRTAEMIVLDFNVMPTGASFPGA